jgi:predicted nucleic-acid-binding protein
LNTPNIKIASDDIITQAIDAYVRKNIDFIDAFSAFWMKENGVKTVLTFDKKHFSRIEGIETRIP